MQYTLYNFFICQEDIIPLGQAARKLRSAKSGMLLLQPSSSASPNWWGNDLRSRAHLRDPSRAVSFKIRHVPVDVLLSVSVSSVIDFWFWGRCENVGRNLICLCAGEGALAAFNRRVQERLRPKVLRRIGGEFPPRHGYKRGCKNNDYRFALESDERNISFLLGLLK